jgi:hypothetical protein
MQCSTIGCNSFLLSISVSITPCCTRHALDKALIFSIMLGMLAILSDSSDCSTSYINLIPYETGWDKKSVCSLLLLVGVLYNIGSHI